METAVCHVPTNRMSAVVRTSVLPFVTEHTFCASRNGPRNEGFLGCVPMQMYSCMVYDYARKADLSKRIGGPRTFSFFRKS